MRSTSKTYAAIGAIIGWLVVILQLYLILVNGKDSVPFTLLKFFSYFTILTNILTAFTCTVVALRKPPTGRLALVTSSNWLTAVCVYILIVGFIYNCILRFLWAPQGLQRIVDEGLHTLVPLFYLLFWILYVPKAGLQWRQAFAWLLYPFTYIIYIMLVGAATGFYPYPFADVSQLGYPAALLNGLGILGCFLVLSLILIGIGKLVSK